MSIYQLVVITSPPGYYYFVLHNVPTYVVHSPGTDITYKLTQFRQCATKVIQIILPYPLVNCKNSLVSYCRWYNDTMLSNYLCYCNIIIVI